MANPLPEGKPDEATMTALALSLAPVPEGVTLDPGKFLGFRNYTFQYKTKETAVSKHKQPEPDYVHERAPEAPPQGREPVEHKAGDRVKVHPRHTVHAGVEGKVVSVDPRHGMACVDDGKGKVREWFRHEELERAE